MLKRKKRGFTLVEIVVSMIIMALLAAGLFSVVVSARYVIARSRRRLVAIEFARKQIEELKYFVRDDLWNLSFPANPLANDSTWHNIGGLPAPYTGRFRVDSGPPNTDYRKVTVQVSWNEAAI